MTTKSRVALFSIAAMVLVSLVVSSFQVTAQTKKKKPAGPPKYTLPANSVMRLRLNDSLSSKKNNVGDTFRSTVVDPVYAKGLQVIPPGSIVVGHITHVTRASRKSNAGSMNVTFTSVRLPNEHSYPINGSLTEGKNSDNEGEVKGGSSKKKNIAFIGGGAVVGGLINGAAGAGIGAGVGIGAALLGKGKDAEVKSGTEYNVILNRAIVMPEYRGGAQ